MTRCETDGSYMAMRPDTWQPHRASWLEHENTARLYESEIGSGASALRRRPATAESWTALFRDFAPSNGALCQSSGPVNDCYGLFWFLVYRCRRPSTLLQTWSEAARRARGVDPYVASLSPMCRMWSVVNMARSPETAARPKGRLESDLQRHSRRPFDRAARSGLLDRD